MRRQALTLVVALCLVTTPIAGAAAGQSATTGGTVTAATQELTTGWGGVTVALQTDHLVEYEAGGELHPSWIVSLENDSYQSLDDWTSQEDTRRIVRADNDSDRAVIVAPASAIGLTILDRFGASLSSRNYIERIEVNMQAGTDPVSLEAKSAAFNAPGADWTVDGAFDQRGVAYRDAPHAIPVDVRDALGFDNTSTTGAGADIAIVDTGLSDADGAVFGNGTRGSDIRVDAAKNFVSSSRDTGLAAVEDGNGHGTWVASSIAANTTDPDFDGPLPNANLTIAKALADDGSGETAAIVDAIEWTEAQDTDVLSLSLGSPMYSEAIADAVRDYLEGNGTVAVVAAGNSRQNPATRYISSPSDVPEAGVLTVGATTAEAPTNASSAYFSQVGPNVPSRDGGPSAADGEGVDVAAPGMNTTVKAPTATGAVKNSTLSGTSMATPYVSAVAAATIAENPSLENDTEAVRDRLVDGARPVPKAGLTEVGAGMVAADNAIDDNQPAQEQEDARNDPARRRDDANRGYAGDFQSILAGVSRSASGLGSVLS